MRTGASSSSASASSQRGRWTAADRQGAALAFCTLAVLAALDIGLGRHPNFSAAVVVAPVLAATLARPRPVVLVGIVSLAAAVGLALYDNGSTIADVVRVVMVLIGAVAAAWIARIRIQREAEFRHMQHIAEVAQQALLSPLPRRLGPAALAGWYVSATEEALVGGDFYEAVLCGDALRVILGDVRGKGIEAVRTSAAALGCFREAGESLGSLADVAHRLDARLRRFLGDEDFVTAVLGELRSDGVLTLVNCGHHPPLRVGAGEPEPLSTGRYTRPFGLDPDVQPESFVLEPHESVWFFTDGVLEGRVGGRRGVDLARLASGLGSVEPAGAADTLRRRLQAELGGRFDDDTAVLVIQYSPDHDPEDSRPTPSGQEAGDDHDGSSVGGLPPAPRGALPAGPS